MRTKKMYLWLISQTMNQDYDTYDSAVVAAETIKKARYTSPSEFCENWDGKAVAYDSWCAADYVKVTLLGLAIEGTKPGVICASFNAG